MIGMRRHACNFVCAIHLISYRRLYMLSRMPQQIHTLPTFRRYPILIFVDRHHTQIGFDAVQCKHLCVEIVCTVLMVDLLLRSSKYLQSMLLTKCNVMNICNK